MQRMGAIALIFSLLLFDVHGQYNLRFHYQSNDIHDPRDPITCSGYVPWYFERSTPYIVIRQLVTNGTHVELSQCPLTTTIIYGLYRESNRVECDAKLVNEGCGRVNVSCSVVKNETEEEKVTKEIIVTDKPNIKSFHINYKGVNNDNRTQIFPPGSLIKLICRGDVPAVDGYVYKNLTFSWRNGFLKMQDPPTINITSIFDDKCKAYQTVSAFLYLKGEQLDTSLSCETWYFSPFYRGRYRRTIRKSVRIKTMPERHQILGPVVMYKDELEERSLLSLTCKTTTDLYNTTDVEDIQWCIRKGNNTQYGPLPLQEDPNVEIFNRSMEKTIKSHVLYQLLKNEENVEIICETNHSNTCGSGTFRGTVRFDSEPTKTPNLLQNDARVSSDQPNTLIYLYASASVMIASIIILVAGVVVFCKAKKRVKYETSTSSLKAAADKINIPKAKTSDLIKCKTISEKCQNQTSSGGQTYSNIPVHSGGRSKGVYKSNEADEEGNIYEPMNKHDDDQHVYEGNLHTAELYEEV